jgi:hypothetical protein
MADEETKQIMPMLGPYAGQRISVPIADADKALADGWASDPFAAEPAPLRELTPDEHFEATKEAELYARKWRGEEVPEAGPQTKTEKKAMEARPGADYETREMKSPAEIKPAHSAHPQPAQKKR